MSSLAHPLHVAALLAHAKVRPMTAADVKRMTFPAVAAASGVSIDAQGRVPDEFFYRPMRSEVARILSREREAARRERIRAAMESAVRALDGEGETTVELRWDDFVISSVGAR